MRCLYREQKYFCGEYLDVDIFPVFKKSNIRGRKAKPTSAVQARYNQHCAESKLERIVMENFPFNSLFYNPTYNDEHLPKDDEAAKKSIRNFIRRLKRYRKKKGLPDLKYIITTEKGKRSERYHHHLIINCGDMSIAELDKIWGNGYAYSSTVVFDKCGCPGLCKYFCKGKKPENFIEKQDNDGLTVGNRWSGSRNLVKPKTSKRDGRLSARRLAELSKLGNDGGAEYEKLYPDYSFSQARPFYNDINGGFYIALRMRKNPSKRKKVKGV